MAIKPNTNPENIFYGICYANKTYQGLACYELKLLKSYYGDIVFNISRAKQTFISQLYYLYMVKVPFEYIVSKYINICEATHDGYGRVNKMSKSPMMHIWKI